MKPVPVAIQRLMDEVADVKSGTAYNRWHNRHNRSGTPAPAPTPPSQPTAPIVPKGTDL